MKSTVAEQGGVNGARHENRRTRLRISFDVLRAELGYEPETGRFWWKKRARGRSLSKEPGCIVNNCYRAIAVCGTIYPASYLAWWLHYGRDPGKDVIDHINGKPFDNRIANLREATWAENNQNAKKNHSGIRGASGHSSKRGWRAAISVNGKRIHLGTFDTKSEAALAYAEAEKQYHGEFGLSHGRPDEVEHFCQHCGSLLKKDRKP